MTSKTCSSELHLIVLWANARYKQDVIVADIEKNLEIMASYDIHWSCDKVASNFTRFYGVNLPKNSHKEKECGITGFLLLVVRDNNPKYEYVETSRGTEKVNINIFNLKQKYRQWTRGGHKVHTTNSTQETNHDATLMLGLNYVDLEKSLPEKWDGKTKTIHRDITGANGWKNLEELFYVLNSTVEYVVLRNSEVLPKQFASDLHGDIDILTNNYENLSYIINAKPVFKEKYRVHNFTMVNNQRVLFDFRFVGDSYYDYSFETDLLKSRVLNENGIYVMSDELLFYSLIYHALIHKRRIASDYYEKIYALFVKLGLDKKYDINKYVSPFDLYYQLLEQFLTKHSYSITRPDDKSVFYSMNFASLNTVRGQLEGRFGFNNLMPVHCDITSRAYNIFWTAYDENDTKIFIKTNEYGHLCRNEYRMCKALYDINPSHFVRPLYYRDNRDNKDVCFFASDYIMGDNLEKLVSNNMLSVSDISKIIDDIYQIFISLKSSDVVHRDIRPANFIWHDNRLYLIDFQMAVSKSNYRELSFLKNNKHMIRELGTSEFRTAECVWDDAYSLTKVLEFIGRKDSYAKKYDEIYSAIKSYVGHDVIVASKSHQGKGLGRVWRHIKTMKF